MNKNISRRKHYIFFQLFEYESSNLEEFDYFEQKYHILNPFNFKRRIFFKVAQIIHL